MPPHCTRSFCTPCTRHGTLHARSLLCPSVCLHVQVSSNMQSAMGLMSGPADKVRARDLMAYNLDFTGNPVAGKSFYSLKRKAAGDAECCFHSPQTTNRSGTFVPAFDFTVPFMWEGKQTVAMKVADRHAKAKVCHPHCTCQHPPHTFARIPNTSCPPPTEKSTHDQEAGQVH